MKNVLFLVLGFWIIFSSQILLANEDQDRFDPFAEKTTPAASGNNEFPGKTLESPLSAPAKAVLPQVTEVKTPYPASSFPATGTKEDDDGPVVLKPGLHLLVRIYPEDEYIKGGEMEINAEGNITLSLLGKVKVAGLTVADAEKLLVKLIDADYLVNPEVSIEIKRIKEEAMINTNNFMILGQVAKPGTYPIPPESKKFTLLRAISIAGGFSEIANLKRVKIIKKSGGQERQALQVNVEDMMNGNATDVEIDNGDVINVPESIF